MVQPLFYCLPDQLNPGRHHHQPNLTQSGTATANETYNVVSASKRTGFRDFGILEEHTYSSHTGRTELFFGKTYGLFRARMNN